MAIDGCTHTFEALAQTVLPGYFEQLQSAIKNTPRSAADFHGFKSCSKSLLKKLGRGSDFSGCYVFIDDTGPIYVGISRGVLKRLVQHINSDTHHSASLVYNIASANYPHEMKREQAMNDVIFREHFFSAQTNLRQMKVAFIEIENPVELYLFEVLAAMRLDTSNWNTFRTH